MSSNGELPPQFVPRSYLKAMHVKTARHVKWEELRAELNLPPAELLVREEAMVGLEDGPLLLRGFQVACRVARTLSFPSSSTCGAEMGVAQRRSD